MISKSLFTPPSQDFSAGYESAAGQVIVTDVAAAIIDFGTKTFESQAALGCITTGAAWKFRSPIEGTFIVSANILIASGVGWTEGERIFLSLFKNGTFFKYINLNYMMANHGTNTAAFGALAVRLLPNDYVDIRIQQNSGANRALDASGNSVWMTITGAPT